MIISMIAAVAANGVIGKNNDLAWSLPDDMRFFQQLTKGHAVIMGRKNWESIPEKWRPLPHRQNIILTRDKTYMARGAVIAHDLQEALAIAKNVGKEEIFIIGGAQIYAQAFPLAQWLYLTEVHGKPEGDTFFPEWDKKTWVEISRKHHDIDEKHAYSFDFVRYEKINTMK